MASNGQSVADGFDPPGFPDWIEIYNAGDEGLDFSGWHLTDDEGRLDKWTFPSVMVLPGDYLMVFASGRGGSDAADPGNVDPAGNLHTNFSLSAEGEYVGLTQPDGMTVVSQTVPAFPKQFEDIGYGIAIISEENTLVDIGHEAAVLIPNVDDDAVFGDTWTGSIDSEPFDDAPENGWSIVQNGVGFVDGRSEQLLVTSQSNDAIVAVDLSSKTPAGVWADESDGLNDPTGIVVVGDHVYVVNQGSRTRDVPGELVRFNKDGTGMVVVNGALTPSVGGLTMGPHDGDLYITTGNRVMRYDTLSGVLSQFNQVSLPGNPILKGLTWGPDGNLYLADRQRNASNPESGAVLRLDQQGNFLGPFVEDDNFLIADVTFGPDQSGDTKPDLYLTNLNLDSVPVFVGPGGQQEGSFVVDVLPDDNVLLKNPQGLEFIEGELVIANGGDDSVNSFDISGVTIQGQSATLVSRLMSADDGLDNPNGIVVVSDLGLTGDDVQSDIRSEMQNVNASAYVRFEFDIADDTQIGLFDKLELQMQYDDGFVAYLNGVEVARRNAPGTMGVPLAFDASSYGPRSGLLAREVENINVTGYLELLRSSSHGPPNVLAIHGLNVSAENANFLVRARLIASKNSVSATLRYYDPATPGASNEGGFVDFVRDTQFSVDRGIFEQPQDIIVSSATPGASIIYTLDGSMPTLDNGIRVDPPGNSTPLAPIHVASTTIVRAMAVRDGYLPTNVDTHTYLFVDDVLTQPINPVGYPDQWGARTADYAMDERVTGPQRDQVIEGLYSLPTMSLVMDSEEMFGATGIYSNPEERGEPWERATSVEFFDPSTKDQFQIDAGVQIMGGTSRQPQIGKHSLRLVFKRDFGPPRLEFPFFGAGGARWFNTLALRSITHDGWAFGAVGANSVGQPMYLRDLFTRRTQQAMGQLSSRGNWVHLYINGLYWGLYNPSERPDAAFAAGNLGGEREDYDSVRANAMVEIEAVDGDLEAWRSLLSTSDNAVRDGHIDDLEFAQIGDLVDITALIDYVLLFYWNGSRDGPVSGQGLVLPRNWYAVRDRADNSDGFKFIWWDAEFTLESLGVDRTDIMGVQNPARVFAQLTSNAEFRQRVADRVQLHFFNEGSLSVTATTKRFEEMVDTIERSMVAESARWGDHHAFQPTNSSLRTLDGSWFPELDRLREDWFPVRTNLVLEQLASVGLTADVIAPQYYVDSMPQRGGPISAARKLELIAPEETITTSLVSPSAQGQFIVPNSSIDAQIGDTWTGAEPIFDDSSTAGWSQITTPVQFGDDSGVEAAMEGVNSSVYIRIPFEFNADLMRFQSLKLQMQYDDGFVAYLNGTEVARRNAFGAAGEPVVYFFGAIDRHEAGIVEEIDISQFVDELRDGPNILAIHGLNLGPSDVDFFMLPQLVATTLVTPADATIYYTVDGADPRMPGGAVSMSAQTYDDVFSLSKTTVVKSRTFRDGNWSALSIARFTFPVTTVRISEINYHPQTPSAGELAAVPGVIDEDFEFIEVVNIGDEVVNLDDFDFNGGVEFDFPPFQLLAGQAAVVVQDTESFRARYGDGPRVIGTFDDGRLSNQGETISLTRQADNVILEIVGYTDQAPWPEDADGAGRTLELIDPFSIPLDKFSDAIRWRASAQLGGTPGTVGSQFDGDFDQNGVVDAVDIDLLFAEISSGSHKLAFDLTADGLVTSADADHLLLNVLATQYGDVDLDKDVDFADFVTLSNNFNRNGPQIGWANADFDGDRAVLFSDFVLLTNAFGIGPLT